MKTERKGTRGALALLLALLLALGAPAFCFAEGGETAENAPESSALAEETLPPVAEEPQAQPEETEEPAAEPPEEPAVPSDDESLEGSAEPQAEDGAAGQTAQVPPLLPNVPEDAELTRPADAGVVEITLPTTAANSSSALDFILDPQGLIDATDAARYGGVPYERGATLFFRNMEGAYALSSSSDRLRVFSSGNVPVLISVSARLDHLGAIGVSPDPSFAGGGEIYLALEDDEGRVAPFDWNGNVQIYKILPALEMEVEYSFGLTGACNPNGAWEEIRDAHPEIIVTWNIEPILPEVYETAPETAEEPTDSGEETPGIGEEPAEAGEPEEGTETPQEQITVPSDEPKTTEPENATPTDLPQTPPTEEEPPAREPQTPPTEEEPPAREPQTPPTEEEPPAGEPETPPTEEEPPAAEPETPPTEEEPPAGEPETP